MIVQRRVFVSGKVQGVGFRASVVWESRKHPGLKGFVRNLPDGRVEAVFAGDLPDVLSMVAWCGKGPSMAWVNGVSVIEEEVDSSLKDFSQL